MALFQLLESHDKFPRVRTNEFLVYVVYTYNIALLINTIHLFKIAWVEAGKILVDFVRAYKIKWAIYNETWERYLILENWLLAKNDVELNECQVHELARKKEFCTYNVFVTAKELLTIFPC